MKRLTFDEFLVALHEDTAKFFGEAQFVRFLDEDGGVLVVSERDELPTPEEWDEGVDILRVVVAKGAPMLILNGDIGDRDQQVLSAIKIPEGIGVFKAWQMCGMSTDTIVVVAPGLFKEVETRGLEGCQVIFDDGYRPVLLGFDNVDAGLPYREIVELEPIRYEEDEIEEDPGDGDKDQATSDEIPHDPDDPACSCAACEAAHLVELEGGEGVKVHPATCTCDICQMIEAGAEPEEAAIMAEGADDSSNVEEFEAPPDDEPFATPADHGSTPDSGHADPANPPCCGSGHGNGTCEHGEGGCGDGCACKDKTPPHTPTSADQGPVNG